MKSLIISLLAISTYTHAFAENPPEAGAAAALVSPESGPAATTAQNIQAAVQEQAQQAPVAIQAPIQVAAARNVKQNPSKKPVHIKSAQETISKSLHDQQAAAQIERLANNQAPRAKAKVVSTVKHRAKRR